MSTTVILCFYRTQGTAELAAGYNIHIELSITYFESETILQHECYCQYYEMTLHPQIGTPAYNDFIFL